MKFHFAYSQRFLAHFATYFRGRKTKFVLKLQEYCLVITLQPNKILFMRCVCLRFKYRWSATGGPRDPILGRVIRVV